MKDKKTPLLSNNFSRVDKVIDELELPVEQTKNY